MDSIAKEIMMMEYGIIRMPQTGESYTRQITNCVWTFQIPVNDLVSYQNNAVISNVIPRGNAMEVRVIDEQKPNPGAVAAIPTLEDAYLYIFNYLPDKCGPKDASKAPRLTALGRLKEPGADYD